MGKNCVMMQELDCVLQQHSFDQRSGENPPAATISLTSYMFMHDGRATVQQDMLVSMVTGVRRSEDELLKLSQLNEGGEVEEEEKRWACKIFNFG